MKEYLKVNKKAYDCAAEEYSQKDLFGGNNYLFYQPWVDMIFSKYDLTKRHAALELGAGTGQFLKILSDNRFKTTTIEFSSKMVEYIKKTSPHTLIIKKNIIDVILKNDEYDLIVAMAFLHCFDEEDLKTILNKVGKWLKGDGYFAICTTLHNITEEGYFEKQDYQREIFRYRKKWNKNDFERILDNAGFVIVDEFFHSEITKPKAWVSYLVKKNKVLENPLIP